MIQAPLASMQWNPIFLSLVLCVVGAATSGAFTYELSQWWKAERLGEQIVVPLVLLVLICILALMLFIGMLWVAVLGILHIEVLLSIAFGFLVGWAVNRRDFPTAKPPKDSDHSA